MILEIGLFSINSERLVYTFNILSENFQRGNNIRVQNDWTWINFIFYIGSKFSLNVSNDMRQITLWFHALILKGYTSHGPTRYLKYILLIFP